MHSYIYRPLFVIYTYFNILYDKHFKVLWLYNKAMHPQVNVNQELVMNRF